MSKSDGSESLAYISPDEKSKVTHKAVKKVKERMSQVIEKSDKWGQPQEDEERLGTTNAIFLGQMEILNETKLGHGPLCVSQQSATPKIQRISLKKTVDTTEILVIHKARRINLSSLPFGSQNTSVLNTKQAR